ncbi:MAG: glycerol kinase GlpK [Fastidiosipila sp.]|nr:glycerol kinase GlpK [Fastidiosipila sp.]
MRKLVLAIDQGTTSSRCIIFDHSGSLIASEQKEHTQIFPKPGWVEHDPLEIWNSVQFIIRGCLDKSNISAEQICACGITNQRETTVVWNRHTGRPVYNAIVWQDTRTELFMSRLAADNDQDHFRKIVGLPANPYFSASKINWILDNVSGAKEKAHNGDLLFGTIDSWLIWNMTGGINGGKHITDVTNASRTFLMNISSLQWDKSMLDLMCVPSSMLPEIKASSAIYGEITLPYLKGVPISGDLGDQQAALFGQTCFSQGDVKNTYGTGCFMLMNTGTKPIQSRNGLLTTLGYKINGEPAVYALEGSVAIAGAMVHWLRDNFKMFEKSDEIEALANTVEDNGGIYFVPAFSGLYAPYWKSQARGVIVGLTRYINAGHLCRATLEATAYQTTEILEAMYRDSGVVLTTLKADGGMVHNNTLMQFQSDILGIPVIRPKVSETTALGAAYAAGLAVGYWDKMEDLRSNWQIDHTWQPSIDKQTCAKLYRGWKKAVTRSFDWEED